MGLINADTVLRSLNEFKQQLHEAKRTRGMLVVDQCIEIVLETPNSTVTALPTMAEKKCIVEKWFPDRDCVTGREVWRCLRCGERVGKNDKFCHDCGAKLIDAET